MRRGLLWVALVLLAACRAPNRAESDVVPTAKAGGRSTGTSAWAEIGRSVEGRPISARTIGSGVRRLYLIGGIHGDERTGGENVSRLNELIGREGAGWVVRVVLDMNPDGTTRGRRANARGVDLNRNWPATNFSPSRQGGTGPLSEPEVRAVHADLTAFEPDVIVVLHAARRGPFTTWDGSAAALAARFAAAAAVYDRRWHVVDDMGYPTPGSIGTWLGVDRHLSILTIECARDQPAEDAWPALRAGFEALLVDRDVTRARRVR